MDFLHIISNNTIEKEWEKIVNQSLGKADLQIVNRIEKEQNSIIKSEKQLGASSWFVLDCYALPENYYAVIMEEGHITNYLIVKHDLVSDLIFSIVESNIENIE
ncbi:hypothetical protein C7121_23855 [Paenibacillus glucanolyticus]|uniref:hypothetical protein n=1 Tax=Paenibacillus TaxID=44249 RepID=UPI0003E29382|nr:MULTISPECIES: hypothetical protein [Paenibacillus]ANA82327.1 hypothetical protein A3958_21155 [Paenibacillus glucanolyticus]AVV58934.1 hypothetical protein C7121_23855 [Paenibacillus glucanolyticus]ETT33745.1 hypothetical protein C169_21678 [Paenibacillus sp. FSL R5-808]MPY17098.1 hypothetical protein [Paenibacillus glucanolyticus]